MPMLIPYMDKIAREKQRDILLLSFENTSNHPEILFDMDKYEDYKPRIDVISWLEDNKIDWQRCAYQGEMGYSGIIYVDVPFDLNDPLYKKLAEHLENSDGTMKIDGVRFLYLPLEKAMEYACQDEPGYWERNNDS